MMGVGEITNFVAYIFAPAILVTPLGVFSIVCTAALSPYFLKEHLRAVGKLGCVLVLVGCVMVTLCGPKDREVSTMDELQDQLLHPGFLAYGSAVVSVSVFLMALVPRYGHKYVLLYITICSSFGSLSVMFCKGVGLALKQTIGGTNGFSHWAAWVCLLCLVVCILIETIYMQRALDLFNSSVFMSVNYIFFTSLVIVASSILYTELRELEWKNILLTILGFVVNIVALFLLHLDKQNNNNSNTQYPRESPECVDGGNNGTSRSASRHQEFTHDQDPQTPLMKKSNIVVKDAIEGAQTSPLSKIGLVPSMFGEEGRKNGTYLAFLNTKCVPQKIQQQEKDQRTQQETSEQLSDDDDPEVASHITPSSRSSISCSNDCSYSSRSNFSDNSSLCSPEDLATTKGHIRTEGTHQSLCEVPLIDELQSSSRLNSLPPLSDERKPLATSPAKRGSENPSQQPRPTNELFSDADEVTQLV